MLLRALGHATREFESAEQFEAFYDGSQPGCLILDLRMPGRSGLDLYRDLLASDRKLPVIFMTAHADVSTAVTAMKTGAIEFLEKPFDRQGLARLVDRALQLDRTWRADQQRFDQLSETLSHLSSTDKETLDLLLGGAPNKAMAAQLHITERAVELRRQRLMQRLHVRSLAELLDLTITHRLLAEFRQVELRKDWR